MLKYIERIKVPKAQCVCYHDPIMWERFGGVVRTPARFIELTRAWNGQAATAMDDRIRLATNGTTRRQDRRGFGRHHAQHVRLSGRCWSDSLKGRVVVMPGGRRKVSIQSPRNLQAPIPADAEYRWSAKVACP